MSEFFLQGDVEAELGLDISPLCDRKTTSIPESQVGFIQYVVQPSFEVLGLCVSFVEETVLPLLRTNLDHWFAEQEGLKLVAADDEAAAELPSEPNKLDEPNSGEGAIEDENSHGGHSGSESYGSDFSEELDGKICGERDENQQSADCQQGQLET